MISKRRFAIFAEVSVLALALAAPAATHPPAVDDQKSGPYVDDTLVISAISDPDATFGVKAQDSPTAIAQVLALATGEIEQTGLATGTAPVTGQWLGVAQTSQQRSKR